MPVFSILIPTRNRASLLESAIQTAISQSFQDIEIIVCDNNSTDQTRQVAERFMRSSDKIRYINPGRDLSMCDNWEFILKHATGTYITFLSDDDGLLPDALAYAHDLIQRFSIKVLVWPQAIYQHPDIPDTKVQSSLYCDIMSGKLFEVSSEAVIEGLCNFEALHGIVPKMLNCVVARELVEQAWSRTEIFFLPPFPDYTAACQLLSLTDTYHFIDLPLYIQGASILSNTGLRYGRREKANAYFSLFGRDLLAGVPYAIKNLTTSYLRATYLHFKEIYPEKFRFPFDMDAYFKSLFKELTTYEEWDDVSEEYEELAAHMRDYYGSGEVFESLWREHAAQKAPGPVRNEGHLRLLTERVKVMIRKTEMLYHAVRKVKHFIAPPRSTYLEFSQVPSMFKAAQLLNEALPSMMVGRDELKPTYADDSRFYEHERHLMLLQLQS